MTSQHRHSTIRGGFTLMELLVVIMVISVLASSMLFAMYGAVQQAKESRTKTQIAKLHELLMTRWDSYRTRAVRVQGLPNAARREARTVATARLLALRELMRLELPDRKEDVLDPITEPARGVIFFAYGGSNVYIPRPACNRQYLRTVANLVTPANLVLGATQWTDQYDDSECLYMIIASMQDITANGLDFLHESEIGDTDGDGMPEILDSWGNPISFLRWAPGFLQHPGADFTTGTGDDVPSYSNLQVEDSLGSPDPFDPLRIDQRTPVAMSSSGPAEYQFNFALYPWICSAGADGERDIVRFPYRKNTLPSGDIEWIRAEFHYFRAPFESGGVPNDPYAIPATAVPAGATPPAQSRWRFGEPLPMFDSSGNIIGYKSGYKDNITNHGLGEGE